MIATAPLMRPRSVLGAEELIELGRPAQARLLPSRAPRRLGAEELIELGQPGSPRPAAPPEARTVVLSPEEGRLVVRLVEDIAAFAQSSSTLIEFQSYCPPDRWEAALTAAGTWSREIERQLKAGARGVAVPAEAIMRIVDLEKCVSAARDARISAARLSFLISAGGAVASTVFGISWLGIPAYVAGLAILLGRPLMARLDPQPREPYKPSIAGGGGCAPSLGDHTDKAKVLERVILSPGAGVRRHHWGEVEPRFGAFEGAVCLSKGRFRVRVEGWRGDRVTPAEGWTAVPAGECAARKEIAVWDCGAPPRGTAFGAVPADSGHEETYWVEYAGPLTGGACRRAGPFG